MRKGFMLPTGGMVIGFLIGLALGFFFGMEFAILISSLASGFFDSMGLLLGTAFGIILLVMLGFLFVKAWYFMVPFTIGLISGIMLNAFIGSEYFGSLTASFFIVTPFSRRNARGKRTFNSHGPPSTLLGDGRMKRKVLAVVLVLCLGLIPIPGIKNTTATNNQNFVITDADSNLVSLRQAFPDTNYDDVVYIWNDTGTGDYHCLFRFATNQIHPKSTIYTVKLNVRIEMIGASPGNVSIHAISNSWAELNATWNARLNLSGDYNNGTWFNQGGDYNSTIIDTQEFDIEDNWVEFNITEIYKDWVNNGSENHGLIFLQHELGDGLLTFYKPNGGASSPKLNIIYSGGENQGQSTDLYKDIWNLEGYVNFTTKNASTLYSEISNCVALSGKNETTGYWYTYWPSLGLIENWDIKFGDGLFVLVSVDTTWDHT